MTQTNQITSDVRAAQIAANVREVRQKIAEAAAKAGRAADSVRLVAVSKYAQKDDGVIDALLAADCFDLGESRPQLLLEKAEFFVSRKHQIRWHQIGSLQKNKVRKILPHVSLIHSIDSIDLLETIDRIAKEESLPPIHGLLEINISGDETKQGFSPNTIPFSLGAVAKLTHIQIDGLMCMSGFHSTDEERRKQFAAARKIAENLRSCCPDNCRMTELSMGMSGDFPLAILEGATLVRVGSMLFEGI